MNGTLRDLLAAVGLQPEELTPVGQAPTPQAAVVEWKKLLPMVKTRYRARVFEAHPDRGGDPESFRGIQEAWELISRDRFAVVVWHLIRQFMRPPQPTIRVAVYRGHWPSTVTTDSSFVTYSGAHPFRGTGTGGF